MLGLKNVIKLLLLWMADNDFMVVSRFPVAAWLVCIGFSHPRRIFFLDVATLSCQFSAACLVIVVISGSGRLFPGLRLLAKQDQDWALLPILKVSALCTSI